MRICINLQESLFIVENIIYESDFRCTQKISVDNKKTESIGNIWADWHNQKDNNKYSFYYEKGLWNDEYIVWKF